MTFDDQLLVDRKGFQQLINPLLTATAQTALATALGDSPRFSSEDLKSVGISFEYDPSNLAVVVLTIDPAIRALKRLFEPPVRSDEQPDIQPANFSAFLNLNVLEAIIGRVATARQIYL